MSVRYVLRKVVLDMFKRRKCSVDTRNVFDDNRNRCDGGNESSANEEEYLHDVRPRYGYEATINRVDARNQEQEKYVKK